MVKGIASWEFPKEQSLVEDKPESGTQKYSKCQTPPYEKNKLLLNEYLGDFMHFETIFFLRKMTFSNPPTPLKYGKFHIFLPLPFVKQSFIN